MSQCHSSSGGPHVSYPFRFAPRETRYCRPLWSTETTAVRRSRPDRRPGTSRTTVVAGVHPRAASAPSRPSTVRRPAVAGSDRRRGSAYEPPIAPPAGRRQTLPLRNHPRPAHLHPRTHATNPLQYPPPSRHSETRRASGEAKARLTPLDWARPTPEADTLVFIDAPLLVNNKSGQRRCEHRSVSDMGDGMYLQTRRTWTVLAWAESSCGKLLRRADLTTAMGSMVRRSRGESSVSATPTPPSWATNHSDTTNVRDTNAHQKGCAQPSSGPYGRKRAMD